MTLPTGNRRLPIGVRTFRELREECGYYVDKTGLVRELVEDGRYYSFSRPRRFGKSVLVSTLKSLFQCERDLFEGLAIEPHWDWTRPRPVVHLDLGGGSFDVAGGLQRELTSRLAAMEEDVGIEPKFSGIAERLGSLISHLHCETGQEVVVLVDDFDKPILDVLHLPEMAKANARELRGFYSVIKACDEDLEFCWLTGVSRFSTGTLFGGLNNLEDITLSPDYSSICGYTESDLATVFADRLEGLDRERIREWYSGYGWDGEERVYNPIDVLMLLEEREYSPWWYETGSPRFLIDRLIENGIPWHGFDGIRTSHSLLSWFEVENIAPESLLYQTGYLTVLGSEEVYGRLSYRVGYPNREVRECLNAELLDRVLGRGAERERRAGPLREALVAGDSVGLEEELRSLLAEIPPPWYGKNPMASSESWYASVLYSQLVMLGVDVRAGESGGLGRMNLVVSVNERTWVFEFKMQEDGGPETALQQLKEREYADCYRGLGQPIHLVGVDLSAETPNVVRFESETVRPEGVPDGNGGL